MIHTKSQCWSYENTCHPFCHLLRQFGPPSGDKFSHKKVACQFNLNFRTINYVSRNTNRGSIKVAKVGEFIIIPKRVIKK